VVISVPEEGPSSIRLLDEDGEAVLALPTDG